MTGLPAAHAALMRRSDVLGAAAPAIPAGAVALVLEAGVAQPDDLRFVALADGVRVGLVGLERAVEVVGARSARAGDHLRTPPGPRRAWLVVLDAHRRATVAPLAAPDAPPIATA